MKTYQCEHCDHRSTGKSAAKHHNHHIVWNHTDRDRKLASGRVLKGDK